MRYLLLFIMCWIITSYYLDKKYYKQQKFLYSLVITLFDIFCIISMCILFFIIIYALIKFW